MNQLFFVLIALLAFVIASASAIIFLAFGPQPKAAQRRAESFVYRTYHDGKREYWILQEYVTLSGVLYFKVRDKITHEVSIKGGV